MKNLLKLIFLGIVIALTWNYLDNNSINANEKVSDGIEWIQNQWEKISSYAESETRPTQDDTMPDSRVQNENNLSKEEYAGSEIYVKPGEFDNNIIEHQEEKNFSLPEIKKAREIYTDKPIEDNNSRISNLDWVKNVTKIYSPDSWTLLIRYEKLPLKAEGSLTGGGTTSTNKSTGTFYYLKGNSKTDLISTMSTNVHEIAHGFYRQNVYKYTNENNLLMDWDNAEGYIFLSPARFFYISFPLNSLFPSKELIPVIPESLRTFRFSTYINGNTSTQSEGVIGLLNELHAYYLGSKYLYEMLEAFIIAEESDAVGFLEWVSQSQSSMTAFYEFDFFIKEYLLHMKRNYPADYQALITNSSFLEAYIGIRTSYETLVNNYYSLILNEKHNLNASGKAEARIEDGHLWIRVGQSRRSSGTLIFSEDKETLLPVINSHRYDEIKIDIPRAML